MVTGQQRGRGRSDDLRQTSPGWMKGTRGMASQRPTIENPILNSPYDAPTRCFKFDADGITDEILDERRASEFFVAVSAPKKKSGKQQEIDFLDVSTERVEPRPEATLAPTVCRSLKSGRPDADGWSVKFTVTKDPTKPIPWWKALLLAWVTAAVLSLFFGAGSGVVIFLVTLLALAVVDSVRRRHARRTDIF